MWKRQDRQTPKYRQTFLPFLPGLRSEAMQHSPECGSKPRPAPELPVELWSVILESQSTLVLKNFRLVCWSWARVAPTWLFDTVYVDNYEASWKRLKQLATSRYAHHICKIQWNPLLLPLKPLDGVPWRQQFPNLLSNTTTLDSAHLHQAYRRCVKSARLVTLSERPLNIDFSRLANLHILSIEDNADLESRCDDPVVRRNIHLETPIHESVAVWGQHPRMWLEERDHRSHAAYENLGRLFDLLQTCSTLTDCTINLWTQHWRWLVKTSFRHATIKKMRMIFKFCDEFEGISYDPEVRIEKQMQQAFEDLCRFPQLENLSIEPRFTRPGPMFSKQYTLPDDFTEDDELPHHGIDCDKHSGCKCREWGETLWAIEGRTCSPPAGLGSRAIDSIQAVLHLSLSTLPKIKVLTLHDLTLNAKTLVAWLCSQYTSGTRSCDLTIDLRGRVLLYELDPSLFFELTTSFGVKIVCDATVMYYNMPITDEVHSNVQYDARGRPLSIELPYDGISAFWYAHTGYIDECRVVKILAGPSTYLVQKCIFEYTPFEMPRLPSTIARQIRLVHEPKWVEKWLLNRWAIAHWEFCYCMEIKSDQRIDFYWMTDKREALDRPNCYILLIVVCHEHGPVAFRQDDGDTNHYGSQLDN